ncbi:MAG: hypothetical protein V4704_03080 [Pseudomonadota bacterium]
MKLRLAIMLLAMAMALPAPQANAQAPPSLTISATCRTPPASGDGGTFQCTSESARLLAPAGFAFVRATLDGGFVESGGPKPACDVEWTELVALSPGSDQKEPRVLTLRARANSQRGYGRRGPGWANCSYSVQLVPYVTP